LIITDIRKSNALNGFDLLTAIVLNFEGQDESRILSMAKKYCNSLLILESATAEKDHPEIGVRCGDQFLRMWIKTHHNFKVGDEICL
jgi:hypothetical protein